MYHARIVEAKANLSLKGEYTPFIKQGLNTFVILCMLIGSSRGKFVQRYFCGPLEISCEVGVQIVSATRRILSQSPNRRRGGRKRMTLHVRGDQRSVSFAEMITDTL